ncbi:sulfurtransferase [Corticibacterium sp. UT-5YL-CI-8]|nr:sulfurtransferase [Tianweitania sp. UT-5YL-CI-8]
MDTFLIETAWLDDNRHDPKVRVIDCSWYIPEAGKSALTEFRDAHIPGAGFFDLDAASDSGSPYVNMLPSGEQFEIVARTLGIDHDTLVVVYDSSYVSARVWWMFRLFGHDNVRILNGGWKRWKQEGRATESGDAKVRETGDFSARRPQAGVATWQDVLSATQGDSIAVVDARTKERFTGEMPSGYPGVAGGHMPGAANLSWGKMIPQSGDFTFVAPEKAAELFVEAGVDLTKPIITTCGSGVTAAILAFQLARLGKSDVTLYDGSWHEWGQRQDLPKESV